MIDTCLINISTTCSRLNEINNIRESINVVQLSFAFDWSVQSDTTALVYDLYKKELLPLAEKLELDLQFQGLGGKQTGSIYCDICCEIQKSEIILFDISTHNINVLFELGLAIGSGAYVYLLRSRHQKRPKKEFSDLSGILEYRYTRPGGRLSFQANLIGDIYSKLQTISENRARIHQIG